LPSYGGNASSYASATNAGKASASATASSGPSINPPDELIAHALATGGAGFSANATANTQFVQLNAAALVDNQTAGVGESIATIGQKLAIPTDNVSQSVIAYGEAAPGTNDVNSLLTGQSAAVVQQEFNSGNGGQVWLAGEMGVQNTTTDSFTHDFKSELSLTYSDIPAILNSKNQDLQIGLVNLAIDNQLLSGNGDSLTFSYTISSLNNTLYGPAPLEESFTFNSANVQQAGNFFADNLLDAGNLASLGRIYGYDFNINLTLNLISSTPTTGENFEVIVGSTPAQVPIPSPILLFGSALLALTNKGFRSCLLPWL
ncbi:MAG: hypothetical protein ABSB19_19690, partial [Methylomonas sp.]